MNRFVTLLAALLFSGPLVALLIGEHTRGAGDAVQRTVRPPAELARPAGAPAETAATAVDRRWREPEPPTFRMPGEDQLFQDAARVAWAYVEGQSHPGTALVNSVLNYPYGTIWDVASGLAALYSAHELGLLSKAEYDARMSRALRTVRAMRLFDGVAYNKNYQLASGRPAGRNDRERPPRPDGYGWSATDIGRLLVWMKIIASSHPQHAADAEAVVRRIRADRLVRDGYLWGESLGSGGRERVYQEGRVGYEQYAAAGFALWGIYADRALSLRQNAQPVRVYDVELLADRRGQGQLTGEPFFLMGLELGWWDPEWERQAHAIMAAQRARYQRTNRLTMVSEDALPIPPYYFYYYTVYDDGRPFAVTAMGTRMPRPAPRWVSTKAAFAWYALLPQEYSWMTLGEVARRAGDPTLGWSSGIYEDTKRPTGSQNINTAAVVLEAALYHRRRRPLLADAAVEVPAPAAPVADTAAGR